MRNATMVGLMALVFVAGSAEKDSKKPKYRVTTYLTGTEIADPFVLEGAKSLVNRMFAAVDIRLKWEVGAPSKAGCPTSADAEIVIRLSTGTPVDFVPDKPAYSLPFASSGERIRVFYDRAVTPVRKNPRVAITFLAHVLAHEMTHVLQGSGWHSEQGLMTTQWTAGDLARMDFGPLPFGREDAQLLRQGIERGSCGKTR